MALARIKNIQGSFSKQYRNARTVDFLEVRLVEAIYIVAHICRFVGKAMEICRNIIAARTRQTRVWISVERKEGVC